MRADVDALLLALDVPKDHLGGPQHEKVPDALRHEPKPLRRALSPIDRFDAGNLLQRADGVPQTGGVVEIEIADAAEIVVVDDVLILDDRDKHRLNSSLRQLGGEVNGAMFRRHPMVSRNIDLAPRLLIGDAADELIQPLQMALRRLMLGWKLVH